MSARVESNASLWLECHLCNLYNDVSLSRTGEKTRNEVKEDLRKHVVNAMRYSEKMCINLGEEVIRMSDFESEMLKPNVIFDFVEGRKSENYYKLLQESDKYTDNVTRKINGEFHMGDKFHLIFMTESYDDDEINEILNHLPNEHLEIFIVE